MKAVNVSSYASLVERWTCTHTHKRNRKQLTILANDGTEISTAPVLLSDFKRWLISDAVASTSSMFQFAG